MRFWVYNETQTDGEDIQKALFMNLKDIEDAIQVQTALTI